MRSMLKRNETLIKKKLWQYLIPSIMTNMAMQIGNVVDTILVGNILGKEAMSSVQIGSTVLLLIQIPGYMLGIGGCIVAAIRMGKRDIDGASGVFGGCLFAAAASGMAMMICAFFSNPIARMLTGGEGVLTGDVSSVIRVMFLGAPLLGIALVFLNFMEVDNHPKLTTMYVVVSNVINLLSDFLLLKYTSIGPAGSVLSTLIGYGAAMIVVIFYFRSPKRMLHLKLSFKALSTALLTGIPALLMIACQVVRNWLMNIMIIRYAGEDGTAIYTICLNLIMIAELFLGGIIEVMSKVGGVVYGEKDYFGLRSLSKNILKYSYIVLVGLMILLFIFAKQAAAIFGRDDPVLLEEAQPAIRIFIFALPFYVFCRFFSAYYQTTEKARLSNMIIVLELVVLLIPSVLVALNLASSNGTSAINATMAGMVVAEMLTVIVTTVVVKLTGKGQGMLRIPSGEEDVLDVSVGRNMAEVSAIPRDIISFCEGKLDPIRANQLAVAAEEMAANAVTYGGEGLSSIDVMLSFQDDKVLLRLRDNGIPFDPTDYSVDGDEFEFSGIELVRGLADDITYLRVLDFNNTTLEFSKGTISEAV